MKFRPVASAGFGFSRPLRLSLMASVAVIGLAVTAPQPVIAQTVPPAAPCNTVSGTTVTCTGNVSAGINVNINSPYTVLNVNSLTSNITPAAGKAAIQWGTLGLGATESAVTINSNLGNYAIIGTGDGIDVHSGSATGSITINSTGSISVSGDGIAAHIDFSSIEQRLGDVSIIHTGSIYTSGGAGIRASAQLGDVYVKNTGNIDGGAIFASSDKGFVQVITSGNVSGIHLSGGTLVSDGHIEYGINQVTDSDGRQGEPIWNSTITNSASINAPGIFGGIKSLHQFYAGDVQDVLITVNNSGDIDATASTYGRLESIPIYGFVRLFDHQPVGDLVISNSGDLAAFGGSRYAAGIRGYVCWERSDTGTCYAYEVGRSNNGGRNLTITNSGRITRTASSYSYFTGIDALHAGFGRFDVTNAAGGVLESVYGIQMRAYGEFTGGSVTNAGEIKSMPGDTPSIYGLDVRLKADSDSGLPPSPGLVTVSNSGSIEAGTPIAVRQKVTGAVTITNSGALDATGADPFWLVFQPPPTAGIRLLSSDGESAFTIDNTGTGEITSVEKGILAMVEPDAGAAFAGSLTVSSAGTITSTEEGMYALSLDRSGLQGGAVTVRQTGGTITSQTRSAMVAGTKDADLTMEAGGVAIGATGFAAVRMGGSFERYINYQTYVSDADGRNNTLTITSTGDLRNASGIDGLAILGYSGNEAVTSSGTVTGNIDLGSGTNGFSNLAAGRFNLGSSIDLGGSGAEDFTNAGTLAMGGDGAIMSSELTGDLFLTSSSLLSFDLGAANVVGGPLNDLLTVSGDLTLDGNVTVAETVGGNFTAGIYRLINYGGSLIDNGLSILGAIPNGLTGTIQTSIAGQVNLIASGGGPVDIAYWDGPNVTPGNVANGRGGTSVWNAARTNWTTAAGDANAAWDAGVGVFAGMTGTVTVEGIQAFAGLQFVTDDYRLVAGTGGALDLGTGAFVHVDEGLDATIDVGIAGEGALLKQGEGRLVLLGTNGYEGGTAITAGTLAAGSDQALGSGTVAIADGASLQAAVDGVTLANIITIDGAGPVVGTLDTQGYGFTLSGALRGTGTARKTGTGTLVLRGTDSAIGDLNVAAGGLTNHGTLGVSGKAEMAADTTLTNAAGAGLTVTGGLTGDAGVQMIDNAGILQAEIDLGGGNDDYLLRAPGSQVGAVDGGAGLDSLALNAGVGGRRIAEGDYLNFEDLTLNGEDAASGRFVLAGATAPARQATLDLGSTGTARLVAGELDLVSTTSSLRTGSLTTAEGTRLSGNGVIFGDLSMAGTIAPGASIGTLTVVGDYEQTGDYEVEISHLASQTPGLWLSDRIVTSGAVSFGGTVDVGIDAGSSLDAIKGVAAAQGAMRWRILDGSTPIAASARTARLDAPDGLALGLDYANGGEDVDLFLAWAAPPPVSDQAGLLWQVALQPDLALCDDTAESTQRSCAFLQGGALSVDDDAAHGGDTTGWSGVAGGGGEVRPDLWLGVGAGYRAGDLTGGDYDRLAAYLWGTWSPGSAELRGFAGMGHYGVDGSRRAISGDATSWDYGAWQPYLAAEGRYWMDLTQTVSVTPVAGLTSVWLALPGHEETGAGIENFDTGAQTLWGLATLLGAEARWQVTAELALEATAGWQHLFGDDAVTITGSYDGISGAELSSTSEAVDRDKAALGLGILADLTNNTLLRLNYDAALSANQFTQAGTARITFTW